MNNNYYRGPNNFRGRGFHGHSDGRPYPPPSFFPPPQLPLQPLPYQGNQEGARFNAQRGRGSRQAPNAPTQSGSRTYQPHPYHTGKGPKGTQIQGPTHRSLPNSNSHSGYNHFIEQRPVGQSRQTVQPGPSHAANKRPGTSGAAPGSAVPHPQPHNSSQCAPSQNLPPSNNTTSPSNGVGKLTTRIGKELGFKGRIKSELVDANSTTNISNSQTVTANSEDGIRQTEDSSPKSLRATKTEACEPPENVRPNSQQDSHKELAVPADGAPLLTAGERPPPKPVETQLVESTTPGEASTRTCITEEPGHVEQEAPAGENVLTDAAIPSADLLTSGQGVSTVDHVLERTTTSEEITPTMVLGLGTGFPACSQSDSSAHNNALSSDIVENTPADVLNTLSMVGTAPNRQVFSSSDQHVGDDNTPTDSPRSNFVVSERASQTNTSGETPKPILAGDIPSQPTMQRLASPNCPPLPDSKDALSSLPSESAIECGRSNLFKLESSIANEPQRFHDDDVLKTFTPSPSSTAISHFAQILDDLAKTEPMQQHELSMDTHTSHRGSQQDKVEAIPTQSVTSCTSISRHDPFLNTSISPSQEGDASALRGVDCSEHEITLDVKRELAEQILQFDVDNESQPLPSTGVQEASAFVPGSSSDTHAARTEPSLQDVQDQGGHVFVPDVQEAGQPHLEILPTQSPDVKPEPLDVLIPGQTIGSNAMSKGRAALSRMKARGGAKSKFIPERVPKSLGLKRRPLPVPKTEPPDVVEIPPSPVKQEAAPQVSLPSSALVAEVTVVEDLTLDVPVEPSAKFVTREDMNTHVEKAAGDAGMSEMGTDLVETQAPECDQRHTPTSLLNDQVVDTTSRKAQSTAASMLFSHDTIPEDVPLDPSLGQTYPDVRRAKEEEIPPELSMSVTEVSRLKRESPPCRTFNIGEDKLKTEEDMMGSTPLGLLHQWEVISAPLKRPATIDLFSSTKKTKRRKSELDVPMHRPGWFVRPYAKQSACQPTVNSARNPRHWFSSWADMRTSGFCRIGEGITDSLLGHPIVVVGNEHGIKLEKDQELGQSNVGWKLYVRRGYRRPMDSWELAPSLQIVQPGNFYPYPPNAFPPGSVTSHSLAYMLPSQSPMRQPFEPAKPFGVSAQDLSTLLPLPEVKDENSGPYSIPTLPKQEQAYEAPCKRAHRPPELASLFEASDVGLPILVVSDPRDAGLGVGKEIGPVVLGWFEIVSIEDKVEELDTHEWCFHLKWKADENEERPWWDGVDAQEGQGADVESDVLPPSFYGDRRAEKLAWHCARCGKVNMQTTFRHLKCSSSFCGKHTPDALSPLVLSDVVRNPQDKLPTAKPHPYSPGAAETCWDDGMKTFEYAREGTKMSIHHIFTGNIPTLQEDADVVWRDLQREVVLEFHEYDYRNYFTLEMEILPKSVKDAVAWVEDVIETYGEAAVQDSFVTLKVLAWWKESKRRVSRRLAAQGRPVVLACLGSALTLTLSGVTNKAQLRGSIQSSNEQNGIQTPPDYVVGMVHGDVLFLSGDDFEYHMKRSGGGMLLELASVPASASSLRSTIVS